MFYLPSPVINIGRESLAMTVTTYADTFWVSTPFFYIFAINRKELNHGIRN